MSDEYRTDATLTGTQREQIESFLHDNRVEIVALLDGLTQEQARRQLVPSLTTLLGLVKHAAFAERVWFDVALAGRTRAEIGLPRTVDDSFVLTDDDTIESVRAEYRRAWTNAEEIAAAYSLDDLAVHNRRGPLLTADTTNCPETATKLPGGGHENCPLAAMRSARHDSVCLAAFGG